MSKRIGKFCGVLLASVILALTPLITVIVPLTYQSAIQLAATDNETFHYTEPAQDATPFSKAAVDSYDISTWTQDLSYNTVSEQLTKDNIDNFRDQYPARKNSSGTPLEKKVIDDDEVLGKNITVMTYKYSDIPVHGSYTSPEIKLVANSYFRISVWYYVLGENSTFYLDDYAITLPARNAWEQSSFYVHTDLLTEVTCKATLCLGAKTGQQYIKGAVHYADFHVEAIREREYTDAVAALKSDEYVIDYTDTADQKAYEPLKEFQDDLGNRDTSLIQKQFAFVTADINALSFNDVKVNAIPNILHFTNRTTFYDKDGTNASVMLLAAHDSYASVQLNDFTFTPKAHAVYMFQFYTIGVSESSNSYFRVTNTKDQEDVTYHEIKTISYPYHNGWQLNTIFYLGGYDNDLSYELAFCLGYENNTATGWLAIDDFCIYQVSGGYALDNANATGVHDTRNLGTVEDENSNSINNSHFDIGTANNLGPSYPYPLIEQGAWETNNDNNGIVNAKYWQGLNFPAPTRIIGYSLDNNVYMMRNTTRTTNTLTSPSLSTVAGDTTYISFDACAPVSAKTKAAIMLDDIELGSLSIDAGYWCHYEFAITENEYAASRSYKLVLTMEEIGITYLDNVRSDTTTKTYTNQLNQISTTIDLTNPLTYPKIWHADNEQYFIHADTNGIMLRNTGKTTTTITNSFAYNLSSGTYYQLSFTASGENAFVSLSNFDGTLTVTNTLTLDTQAATYTLYFRANDTVTETNFTVTLGSQEAGVYQDANLYLTALTLTSIEDSDYELAERTHNEASNVKFLTAAVAQEETPENTTDNDDSDFFGKNWWYLVPTLITAVALLIAVLSYLLRKIKFDKHITNKTSSYARDIKIKETKKKIVAEQSAKVDNNTNGPQNH